MKSKRASSSKLCTRLELYSLSYWLADVRVLIIIFCFLRSGTVRPRASKTSRIVSTTRWKLLAAPRSCVKRTMLSSFFLPCSMTVTISAAMATSLMFKSIRGQFIILSFFQAMQNLQLLVPIRANMMSRCLST